MFSARRTPNPPRRRQSKRRNLGFRSRHRITLNDELSGLVLDTVEEASRRGLEIGLGCWLAIVALGGQKQESTSSYL